MDKKILLLTVLIALTTVVVSSITISVYANEIEEQKKDDVIQLIIEKEGKFTKGQLAYITLEYSYCTGYEDYLRSINFSILKKDSVLCLESLEKFLQEI
jgi:hypothetical protein